MLKKMAMVVVAVLVIGVAFQASAGVTYTWGGGSLNWTDTSAAGWNGGPPAATDTGNIGSGTAWMYGGLAGDPTINVNSGGTVRVEAGALTVNNLFLNDGSTLLAGTDSTMSGGTITLSGSVAIYRNTNKRLTLNNSLAGSGSISCQASGGDAFYLTGDNSGYSGAWIVSSPESPYVQHNNGLGSGDVVLNNSNLRLAIDQSWTLTNNLAGSGTFYLGGSSGYSNDRVLTAKGSVVSPGNSAGILAVRYRTGDYNTHVAFALADDTSRATLVIDVTGGGAIAGTDYDQLRMTGDVSGLANAELVVRFADGVSGLEGDVLTILVCDNDLSSEADVFNSRSFEGGFTADVSYNDGSVTLSNFRQSQQSLPVAEPGSAALMLLGALGLAGKRRRA